MNRLVSVFASIAILAGSFAIVPQTAEAAGPDRARYQERRHDEGRHHVRYRHHHRHNCHTVFKKKVVWRHHHRHVVRYKVRICN